MATTPSERIDQHLAGLTDWRGGVLATIRRIALEADPAVTEDWKWMGTPVWSCDGIVCIANPHKGKVKVTFAKGAHVEDAEHLFNAGLDGKEWRAIDLLEKDRLNEAAFLRLVKTAIAYNRAQVKAKAKGKSKAALAPAPKKAASRPSAAKKGKAAPAPAPKKAAGRPSAAKKSKRSASA